MRRFFYWHLPLAFAVVATALFASGFYKYVRGDTGEPVDIVARPVARASAAPSAVATPIILGDSLARGTGDPAGLGIGGRLDQELRRRGIPAKKTVNIAVNGARTVDLLRELDVPNVQRLLAESNVVIVSIGGNDLLGGTDWRNAPPSDPDAMMTRVLDHIDSVVKRIRSDNAKARIFVIGLYNPYTSTPAGRVVTTFVNRWNAKLIEHFATDPNVFIVGTSDIFANHNRLAIDNFHPGGEGYELIARRIADAM